MVSVSNKLQFYGSLVAVLSFIASSLCNNLVAETESCEGVCKKTHPSLIYKNGLRDSCSRGCRLYSIIELIREEDGTNGTVQSCHDNCKDAYPEETEQTSSCLLGCDSQKPFSDRKEQMPVLDPSPLDSELQHMIYPILYMHNIYSNMLDTVTSHMCVSWSVIMHDGAGRMVVMKSQPQIMDLDVQDFDDYSAFKGTSSIIETNIKTSDNTATEMLRHSQLKSARSFGDGINAAEVDLNKYKLDDGSSSDWLTCIARKTGVPRLFLCIIILLSAVAMIWLCMSAAVTAPDQRLSQKLGIYGDLEYLRSLTDKKGIKGMHPQDFVEARPLPVKIRVEQI